MARAVRRAVAAPARRPGPLHVAAAGAFIADMNLHASPVPSAAAAAPPCFAGLPAPDSDDFETLSAFCETHRVDALSALPWVAAEVAQSCGFAAMLRLAHRHGGRRVYLPRGRTACAARLGLELDASAHRRLLDRASAAGTIEVPSAWGVFVALRRVAIRAALRAGCDQREIAHAFGVTERHLRREVDSLQVRAGDAAARTPESRQ